MKSPGKGIKNRILLQPSILSKLMIVIMLTVSMTLLFTALVLSAYEWSVFRSIGRESIATLSGVISRNSTAALAFRDRQVATEILDALTSESEVLLGCLYTKENELLASYSSKENVDPCPVAVPPNGQHFKGGKLAFSRDIIHENEKLGSLYLLSGMQKFTNRLKLYVVLLSGVIGFAGLFAFLLASRLQHLVTGPVLQLAETARFISEKGKYTLRAKESSEVEINSLVHAFNRMLDVIQEREESIRQSEELFRATFDVAAVGKAVIAPNGRFIRVNAEFCKMLGYTSDELLKLTLVDISHPDDVAQSRDEHHALITSKMQSVNFEKRNLTKNGEIVWTNISAAPIRDSAGRVEAIVSVIQDITERKRTEAERDRLLLLEREARLDAEKSIQVRDDFLSIASHELRTPITPLKMHMQLMRRQMKRLKPGLFPRQEDLEKAFETSERQIANLEKLIEGLLDVSRITAGRLILHREPFDLTDLVHDVLEQLQPEVNRSGVRINLSADRDIVGFWDRLRIEQIVINLLTNAMKYGAGKPIDISVSRIEGMASLAVRDYGIGIAEVDHQKIFERFERAAPIKHYAGLGLGLFIARELAEAHGGTISVESALGEGSLFVVDLPMEAPRVSEIKESTRRLTSGLTLWFALLISPLFAIGHASAESKRDSQIEELAELPIEELTNITISSIATGTRKPVVEAPSVTSVITSEEIEAIGATTLEDALEAIPGLHVSNASELYSSKYLIRGLSTRFNPETLVLINGIPISSIVRGDRNARLGVLPVKMIARIEVIRGPGSALYGADAFAGVINVVTKNASDIRGTEAGGGIGSFNSNEVWLFHGVESGKLKGSLMVDYRSTSGHKREIVEDAQTRLDAATGTNASLAPGPVNLSERGLGLFLDLEERKWRLRGSFYGKSNLGTGQGIGEALDPQGRFSLSRTTADLTFHDPGFREDWDFTSQLSFHHENEEIDRYLLIFPPGANLGQGVFPNGVIASPEYWERHIRFDNSVFYTGFQSHRIRIGAGYSSVHLYKVRATTNRTANNEPLPDPVNRTDTSLIYLPENSRYRLYGYGQDEWRFSEDWELTVGTRYDRYSDFGGTLNPRAALVWKTTPKVTTKLIYGRAFREPNFTELYTANNPITIGNPNLKPETLNSYEFAGAWQLTPGWQANLNLFYYDVYDLIEFVRDPNGTATAQNTGRKRGRGLELESTLKATKSIYLTGNYAMVKVTDEHSRNAGAGYPDQKAYGRVEWKFTEGRSLGAQITLIGPRTRMPDDPRTRLRGYSTVDLIGRWAPSPDGFELTASIRNLLSADVREPSVGPGPGAPSAAIPYDLPQAGLNAYIEVAYSFK